MSHCHKTEPLRDKEQNPNALCPLQSGDGAPAWDRHPGPAVLRPAQVRPRPGKQLSACGLPVAVVWELAGVPGTCLPATCPIVPDPAVIYLSALNSQKSVTGRTPEMWADGV